MPTLYAVIADITLHGLPATALGVLTNSQQQAALDAAGDEMDDYFRARYLLPFTSFGISLTQKCVWIAQYNLMAVRGYAPNAKMDQQIQERYDKAIKWLTDVKLQLIHPNVVSNSTLQSDAPLCSSQTPRGYTNSNSVLDTGDT
jgi:phage gp36-like protein